MIKRGYTGNQRQACNVIWNAAGRYDYDPPFLAFRTNGVPDFYFNMVIGFVEKYFDSDRVEAFLESYRRDRRADEFDDLLWLGIENCVYEKELASRPILAALRIRRGEEFFRYAQDMSEQQMMLQSMLVWNQQEARWAEVTGRRIPILSGREKRMRDALRFPGSFGTDDLVRAMEDFLGTFFNFDAARVSKSPIDPVRERVFHFLHRGRPVRDLLIVPAGGSVSENGLVTLPHDAERHVNAAAAEKDERYIRGCFGNCIFDEVRMEALRAEVCTGADRNVRLWLSSAARLSFAEESSDRSAEDKMSDSQSGETMGRLWDRLERDASGKVPDRQDRVFAGKLRDRTDRDIAQTLSDRRRQTEKNLEFYKKWQLPAREAIRKLAQETETILSTYMRHLPTAARAGELNTEKAWRLPVLSDPAVFQKPGDETEHHITADLLLDASQSRMNDQEVIAAEAYITAKAFTQAGIPVRVVDFHSLRGYTVLEILKDYGEDPENIFRYFAGGWNRDSAALKCMRALLADKTGDPDHIRLLFVLTDASPNDVLPIPPSGTEKRPREYEGAAGVRETAAAVKALREDGVCTAAVFHGASMHLENVPQIYGDCYTSVRRMRQLSDGIRILVEQMLRNYRRD